MNRTVSLSLVVAIALWALAIALFAPGVGIAVADVADLHNQTWGAILAVAGMLCCGGAMTLSAKVIADRRTRRIINVITAVDEVNSQRR